MLYPRSSFSAFIDKLYRNAGSRFKKQVLPFFLTLLGFMPIAFS